MQTVSLGWQHFDVEEWQLSNGRGNSLLATLFKQNLHSGTSSLKSVLHPTASTAASSLHLLSYEHTLSVSRSFVFDRG